MKKSQRKTRLTRGQSLVEFALVSVLLFQFLLGIMEFARFMYTYSVISNAAQEGSRYGIVRPRDVISAAAATQTRAAGGPTVPVPTVMVINNGSCDVVDKALDKVFAVPRSDVNVSVSYDQGDGTPIPVNNDPSSPNYYDKVIQAGNRIVVETNYKFQFIVPYFNVFSPNGINVKMSSARTIVNSGSSSVICAVDMTPVITPIPTHTSTQTPYGAPQCQDRFWAKLR